VQADFSIELGRDDETLELPWAADGGLRFYDLKRRPELITQVEEAARFPELREFLLAVNAPTSMIETAKCDAWCSNDINPEEEIFGAPCKFGSYVDLVLSDENVRYSFPDHENLARRLTELLKRVPEIPASAEFLMRRCCYHQQDPEPLRDGFYITFYVFGFGFDEAQARQRWGIGLKLVENAIGQLSATKNQD
jgi:hypothetical protein